MQMNRIGSSDFISIKNEKDTGTRWQGKASTPFDLTLYP